MSDNKTWKWQLFGNDLMVATFQPNETPPSLRVRILSRIIMGSKWERVEWKQRDTVEEK